MGRTLAEKVWDAHVVVRVLHRAQQQALGKLTAANRQHPVEERCHLVDRDRPPDADHLLVPRRSSPDPVDQPYRREHTEYGDRGRE